MFTVFMIAFYMLDGEMHAVFDQHQQVELHFPSLFKPFIRMKHDSVAHIIDKNVILIFF